MSKHTPESILITRHGFHKSMMNQPSDLMWHAVYSVIEDYSSGVNAELQEDNERLRESMSISLKKYRELVLRRNELHEENERLKRKVNDLEDETEIYSLESAELKSLKKSLFESPLKEYMTTREDVSFHDKMLHGIHGLVHAKLIGNDQLKEHADTLQSLNAELVEALTKANQYAVAWQARDIQPLIGENLDADVDYFYSLIHPKS